MSKKGIKFFGNRDILCFYQECFLQIETVGGIQVKLHQPNDLNTVSVQKVRGSISDCDKFLEILLFWTFSQVQMSKRHLRCRPCMSSLNFMKHLINSRIE